MYNEEILGAYISEKEYVMMITHLNNIISGIWPCSCIFYFGYLLAPFTFGLSFLLPNLCITDAQASLKNRIAVENRNMLLSKNLELVYVKGISTSWLEIRVLDDKMRQ